MLNALAAASFLRKGEIIQNCKGVIAFIKNNRVSIEQSFPSAPLGHKDLKHNTMQVGGFSYWKRYLNKNSLQAFGKGSYQVLLTNNYDAKVQGLDSWIHVTHGEKALISGWT